MNTFRLLPFDSVDVNNCVIPTPLITIEGNITRHRHNLTVQYFINGEISSVRWPKQEDSPQRKKNLWQHTCMELFVSSKRSGQYCEYNLSPSGDWNAFHFEAYRKGKIELNIEAIKMDVCQHDQSSTSLTATLPIETAYQCGPLATGVSAVIEDCSGLQHYYALLHCGSKPDFHLDNSFVINLT